MDINLFIIVAVFHLLIISSLVSLGHQMYHRIIRHKGFSTMTKICVVILMTICSFMIVLFLLDIITQLIFFYHMG